MGKKPNKKELVKANPLIDTRLLEQSLALIKELEKQGVKRSGYDLSLPFSRTLQATEGGKADPRTVHLGR
ncbi:MAG: hypothetical protein KAX44_02425 [Candidatus Brocadiae bacterium]|nr:hypothetical protein [Candidatus Brocadiia bacterium]